MNRPFVGLLLTLFAGGVAATPIRTLLPAYVEGVLHQPPVLTSVLLAIQLGTGGVFALFAGALATRAGQRAIVLAGLGTPIVGAALLVIQAPPLLVLVAVLWGVAAGFHSAGGQSFMIAAVRRERLGSASAAYFLSTTASGAVGAYAAGLTADHLGYGTVALASATLGIVSLALAARLLPNLEPPGDAALPRPLADSPASPAPGGSAGRASAASEAPEKSARGFGGAQRPPIGGYGELLGRAEVIGLCAVRYFPTFAWGIASLAIPLLIFRLSGSSASTLGAYGTVSLLCAGAAQIATGRLVDRLHGSVRTLLAPLTAAIVGAALLAAVAAAAESLPALFAAGTLWTMSAWALSTTMPPLIREVGGGAPGGSDRLVGLAHLMWSAGMLSGTLSAGALIEVSPVAPILLALTCLAIALASAFWVTSLRDVPAPA